MWNSKKYTICFILGSVFALQAGSSIGGAISGISGNPADSADCRETPVWQDAPARPAELVSVAPQLVCITPAQNNTPAHIVLQMICRLMS